MKLKEKEIENLILEYLSYHTGEFWKIDYPRGFSGDNTFIKNSNKYVRKGMSDIIGIKNGKFYAFEVKTPEEHKKIMRSYSKYRVYMGKSKTMKRYRDQIAFIESVRLQGGFSGFVSSLSDVNKILQQSYSAPERAPS